MDSLRLVLYAQSKGRNEELMAALGWRHFADDRELADRAVLLEAAAEAGLPRREAEAVLDSDRFEAELADAILIGQTETAVLDPGTNVVLAGIPMLVFRTTNPRRRDFKEKLHGSVPQRDIEAVLRRIEAFEAVR